MHLPFADHLLRVRRSPELEGHGHGPRPWIRADGRGAASACSASTGWWCAARRCRGRCSRPPTGWSWSSAPERGPTPSTPTPRPRKGCSSPTSQDATPPPSPSSRWDCSWRSTADRRQRRRTCATASGTSSGYSKAEGPTRVDHGHHRSRVDRPAVAERGGGSACRCRRWPSPTARRTSSPGRGLRHHDVRPVAGEPVLPPTSSASTSRPARTPGTSVDANFLARMKTGAVCSTPRGRRRRRGRPARRAGPGCGTRRSRRLRRRTEHGPGSVGLGARPASRRGPTHHIGASTDRPSAPSPRGWPRSWTRSSAGRRVTA